MYVVTFDKYRLLDKIINKYFLLTMGQLRKITTRCAKFSYENLISMKEQLLFRKMEKIGLGNPW